MNKGIINKLKSWARWQKRKVLYLLRDNEAIKNHQYSKTIIVAGMGRSGSTWLGEMLNFKGECRELFEPFRPDKVTLARSFSYPYYIRPTHSNKELIEDASKILDGHFTSLWSDIKDYSNLRQKILLKDIRINLYLKWIHHHFPQHPIILLVRHPGPLILSWLKSGFGTGEKEVNFLFSQEALVKDYLSPHTDLINRSSSSIEWLSIFWCIYYGVPFQQFCQNEICLVFYENLLIKPEEELKRIAEFTGETYDPEIVKFLKIPSRTTLKKTRNHWEQDVQSLINNWKTLLSEEDQRKLFAVMERFNLRNLYSSETVPRQSLCLKSRPFSA